MPFRFALQIVRPTRFSYVCLPNTPIQPTDSASAPLAGPSLRRRRSRDHQSKRHCESTMTISVTGAAAEDDEDDDDDDEDEDEDEDDEAPAPALVRTLVAAGERIARPLPCRPKRMTKLPGAHTPWPASTSMTISAPNVPVCRSDRQSRPRNTPVASMAREFGSSTWSKGALSPETASVYVVPGQPAPLFGGAA